MREQIENAACYFDKLMPPIGSELGIALLALKLRSMTSRRLGAGPCVSLCRVSRTFERQLVGVSHTTVHCLDIIVVLHKLSIGLQTIQMVSRLFIASVEQPAGNAAELQAESIRRVHHTLLIPDRASRDRRFYVASQARIALCSRQEA